MIFSEYPHLSADPTILGGKPCIKDTRISIDLILEWFASGATIQGLVEQFPQLSEAGIRDALRYAADRVKQERLVEVKVA